MNFQTIPPVLNSKELLDLAFRKAREKESMKVLKGSWLEIQKKREAIKIDIIKDNLNQRLTKILSAFPETAKMSNFYVRLMKLTLDFETYKKSCGAIVWARNMIGSLQRNYVQRIVKIKEPNKVKETIRQFYGRISSVVKQIDSNLKYLEEARRIMKTYPDIKEMFTVCIYGFPNVGKTTLLNKLTGTKAKTADYSFTTLGINAGYLKIEGKKVQVLDVPGTLAREDKLNLIEMQAELVLEEVANLIIYVFDLSERSGYSFKQQKQLYDKISDKKPLIYLAKEDLTDEEKLKEFKLKNYSLEEITEILQEKARIEEEMKRKAAEKNKEPETGEYSEREE